MIPVSLYNSFHIGDALASAHLLRALAKGSPDRQFWFFVHGNIIAQIHEAVQDIANISMFTFESDQWTQERGHAINGWKNAADHWVKSKHRWDWVNHQLEHHDWTARRLGFTSPFIRATDLLFDYPALGPAVDELPKKWLADWFICNSDPRSGQLIPMCGEGSGYLDKLIWKLGQRYSAFSTQLARGALCTQSMGQSVSIVGRTSVHCQHHILVATGPMWPTLNVHNHHLWNPNRLRIVILDNGEKLTGIPWVQQVSRVEEVEEILKGQDLL